MKISFVLQRWNSLTNNNPAVNDDENNKSCQDKQVGR